jgi:riboflavin synthase
MFTGIIQDIGRLETVTERPDGADWQVSTNLGMDGWQLGDSVAVDGCCLTVTAFPARGMFEATLSPETLARTRFAAARPGWRLNLEPALRLGDALGGHWVTGHIDDVAEVSAVTPAGEHVRMDFTAPAHLAGFVVAKGSVTVNGVSLTVNAVDKCRFSVNLIPHTLEHTNLGALQAGDKVNLETDILGRYVERLLQVRDLQVKGFQAKEDKA